MGGLGNQMFQYAAGRSISHRTGIPFKLDITFFKTAKTRSYQLNCFNIKEDFASTEEINWFKSHRKHIIAFANHKIRTKLLPWYKQRLIRQRGRLYNHGFTLINGSVYLDGYWQSEKYFKDISEIIRSEFTIKYKPNKINSQMINKIKNVNSVSMHIRRGDYVTNHTHEVLKVDYYNKAFDLISKKVKDPCIFVFSDDTKWAKENLNTSVPINFIDHNKGNQDFEDLRLISKCKHHIIANSSFSWWGAWLSEYPNKIIIAPKKWFVEERKVIEDIYISNSIIL